MPGRFVLCSLRNAKVRARFWVKSQMESKFLNSTNFAHLTIVFSEPTIMPDSQQVNICSLRICQVDKHFNILLTFSCGKGLMAMNFLNFYLPEEKYLYLSFIFERYFLYIQNTGSTGYFFPFQHFKGTAPLSCDLYGFRQGLL